jgi:hypothetical protein
MTLEQLMAFTVSPDHERQEQVWEALQRSYTKEPYQIRRLLTEGAVRASDKRARFVGAEAYEAAGGLILRDLFQPDDGGWWQDAGLLDRLARERLEREAEAIRAEGWRWVEVAPDFPYGHTYGLRRLAGEAQPLTEEETARRDALQAEFDRLEQECAEADEVPEENRARETETCFRRVHRLRLLAGKIRRSSLQGKPNFGRGERAIAPTAHDLYDMLDQGGQRDGRRSPCLPTQHPAQPSQPLRGRGLGLPLDFAIGR